MRIQSQLIRLVAAVVAPAALTSALLIGYSYNRQRAVIEDGTLYIARALTQTVDRQIASGQAALQVLATSPHLASGDLAAFHRHAQDALRDTPGNNFVLSAASGQQLVNTLRPFGDALPLHGNLAQLHRVFETGRPAVSDLFFGGVARRSLIAIDVPVRRADRVILVLSMGFFPERLGELITSQKLPPNWVVSIFDSHGTIVARTHEERKYVGQKGAPALVQRMSQVDEGVIETETLEGVPVVAVFSRSAVSRWVVAIGIPRRELAMHWWIPISINIIGAVVLLVFGIVIAQKVGSRIAGSIRGLIPPAVALGQGNPVVVPPLHLVEVDEVGRELVRASERLHDRERTLALVTHDLRSPLSGIRMGATAIERLAARLPGAEPIRELGGSLAEASRRMSGMVDDLLGVAVATSGGRSLLKVAAISPASLLKQAVESARPLFEGSDIALEIEAVGTLPDIHVDADRMLRVFANLLDNALKFTEPPGRVVLRAEAQSDRRYFRYSSPARGRSARVADGVSPSAVGVRFCVSNSGPALSADEMRRMFQPFWQAGSGNERGAGLGLAICRSIVEAHGGKIWAEPMPGMRVRICFLLHLSAT